jgi:hypothetical protein
LLVFDAAAFAHKSATVHDKYATGVSFKPRAKKKLPISQDGSGDTGADVV